LLAENAVKHNIISEEKPLHITISEQNGCIAVTNPIQKKAVLESSTGIGLKNIIERYKYFSERPVQIEENDGKFTVCLPVLSEEMKSVRVTVEDVAIAG
jgi:sensor histidine kinase YesM